jgi:hypothetical protein
MPKGQASHASGSSDKGATIRKPTKGQASVAPLSPIIDAIQEQWRRRQAWHRAEKSLTLAAKALCRRFCAGDKAAARLLYEAAMKLRKSTVVVSKPDLLVTQALFAMMPILTARDHLETSRETLEDRMLPLVKQLPVAGWWLAINGCGLLGLAGIIGEAGDLSKYPKHGHLWKRLGLAVMPDGTRQRRVKGKEAREHGYSPARRSVIWNVGNALFKAQSEKPEGKVTAKGKQRAAAPAGEYRLIYDARKAYELLHLPEEKGRAGHAHKRAQRYMEKKLIRRLWKAWRQA